MSKVNVYDLPTRVFHWIFAILFIFSFSIGKFVDDESKLYVYHMLSGITMTFIVIMRIIWGFLGTEYAKFSSFKLRPTDLKNYFLEFISNKNERLLGHNPASSYAALFMFLLTFGLFITGLLMANHIKKSFFEEVHELFALSFLITVILHICGVVLHQVRHKDGMISSMVNGKKQSVESSSPIKTQALFPFLVFCVLLFTFIFQIYQNFDSQKQTLSVFKYSIQLGKTDKKQDVEYYNNYYKMDQD